jgi:hypothetical protein
VIPSICILSLLLLLLLAVELLIHIVIILSDTRHVAWTEVATVLLLSLVHYLIVLN